MTKYFINTKYQSPDRYDLAKFLEFDVDAFSVTNSEFLDELNKLPSGGSYQVIGESKDPSLVAFTVYNDPSMYWIILYYNNLQSEADMLSGMVLEYPTKSDVDKLFFGLKAKQTKSNT